MLLSAQFTHTKLNTHHSVSQQGHEGFSYRSATITEGRRSVMECHRIETSGALLDGLMLLQTEEEQGELN